MKRMAEESGCEDGKCRRRMDMAEGLRRFWLKRGVKPLNPSEDE